MYDFNDCWAGGLRVEWFRDDDGARVFNETASTFAGNFYEIALGLNYRPHSNVVVRPELRWDWFDGIAAPTEPFDRGQASSQFGGGLDVVFTF